MPEMPPFHQSADGSHRSVQQGRPDRGVQSPNSLPALQPGQVQTAGAQVLMRAAREPSPSIAVELALLCLRELEPRVADNPELLVSTEAVLAFAAVRHADPLAWQRWRRVLEKYDKRDLIEHMLGEPPGIDHGSSGSAVDKL